MFFAPAIGHWAGFATHPPLAERIWRAHPRFHRDDYRARRHGRREEVAVLDGAGNVVKHARTADLVATVGRPQPLHLDCGRRLLERLPERVRAALHAPREAEQLLLDIEREVAALGQEHFLALVELALPALKAQPQGERDRFLAELAARVAQDGRITRREFVLLTFLRQHLREGAGQPIPARYRRVAEIGEEARAVLSLVAAASGTAAPAAFARGAALLELDGAPLAPEALAAGAIAQSLERLRHLAPLAKPAVLKACLAVAQADGALSTAEGELVRMVAATLDCPMPPLLGR